MAIQYSDILCSPPIVNSGECLSLCRLHTRQRAEFRLSLDCIRFLDVGAFLKHVLHPLRFHPVIVQAIGRVGSPSEEVRMSTYGIVETRGADVIQYKQSNAIPTYNSPLPTTFNDHSPTALRKITSRIKRNPSISSRHNPHPTPQPPTRA